MNSGLKESTGKGPRKSTSTKGLLFDSIMGAYLFSLLLVGVTRPAQEQLLNLKMNTLIFFALGLLGLAISATLNQLDLKTLGELIFQTPHKKAQQKETTILKSAWGWQLILFLTVTMIAGVQITGASLTKLLDKDSLEPTFRLVSGLLSPNWDILPRAVLLMIETIFVAFMATALAIPISFLLCFFAAKNIMKSPTAFGVYMLLRTILNICRSVEAFIWAIIFSVWVGFGPFAGMLALLVHSVMSLTKQFSEIVETVQDGPIEGIQSTGATRVQTIWFAIVPQVILPFVSFTIYRWDINIRMATIVGFVGGGGIGYLLQLYQGQAMWPEVATIFVVIAFVVWFMDTSSAYLREALK